MKKMAKAPAKPKAAKAPKADMEPGGLPELHRDDDSERPQDYEVEDAVRTLGRAEEIKKDPKLMPHVQKHISKKITSLKDLKKMAGQKALEESNDET